MMSFRAKKSKNYACWVRKKTQNFAFFIQFILPLAFDDANLRKMGLTEVEQIIKLDFY